MKKIRLFSLVAMLCMVQSIMAQLTSLGLVEEGRCSIGHHKPIPKLEISDNFLYASTEKGLYRYELDGDEGWLQMPITDCPVTDFFVNGDTLIITTMEQLYVSYNGGINVDTFSIIDIYDTEWVSFYGKIPILGVHPHNAKRFYVGHHNYAAYTEDGGTTWSRQKNIGACGISYNPLDTQLLVGYFNDIMNGIARLNISFDGGDNWQTETYEAEGYITGLLFHPTDKDKILIYGEDIYSIIDTLATPREEWKNNGTIDFMDIAYSTHNSNILYGVSGTCVKRSTNGGHTWDNFHDMTGIGSLVSIAMHNNTLYLYTTENGIHSLKVEDESEPSLPSTKRGYGIYHGDSYLYAYTINEAEAVTDSTDFARWNEKTVIYFDVDTVGTNAFTNAIFRQGQILYFTERLNCIMPDAFTNILMLDEKQTEETPFGDLCIVFNGNAPSIDKSSISNYADTTYRITYVVPDLAAYIENDIQWTYSQLVTIDDFVKGYISPENEVIVNDSTEMDVKNDMDNTNTPNNVDLVVNARPRKDIPVRIGEGENKDIYSRAPAWMRYTMELRITDIEGTELYAGEMQCSAYGECQFNVSFTCPANNIIHIYSRSIDMFGRATAWAVTTFNLDTSIDPIVAPNTDAPYYDLQGRPVANPTRGIYIKNGRKVVL